MDFNDQLRRFFGTDDLDSLTPAALVRTEAAALMGISRRTLHRKLAQWPELDVVDR